MYEPDPEVVRSAARGDLGAFESLVRAYQSDVWRLCLHLLGNRAAADDAAQDALVRAYRFLPRYRGDSKFSTWLFAITRNCCVDELRRKKRRSALVEAVGAEPRERARDVGTRLEVRDALATLPQELLEPVVLIDMFGHSYRDAAQVLGIPEGTVKSRVHRARELLVRTLQIEERADES
ncbi:MAG: sigma-70 family RNA polymerase sigma factor [Actinomycetota bacterium]|nr:sigma-70 family RNA polymerase sigma factor [Actinomycetota bacterium]